MSNLYDRLAASFPDDGAPFAYLPDGAIISYGEVDQLSARYANVLRSLNVATGDRVAVQAEKSIDMLMLYLGCLRAGAVFLPLNTAYTGEEIRYFLSDAEPALFVCSPHKLDGSRAIADGAGVRRVESLGEKGDGSLALAAQSVPASFGNVACAGDDLAAILYTSGTTGRSKGAMLTHDNLASNCETLKAAWRFTSQDRLLHALPIFHTHGLFVATNIVLAAGASMEFLPRFDIDAILAALPGSSVMMGVPTFYIRLLDEPRFTKELVQHMRLFISGSAPLSADIHRAFFERTGHAILERYGMTETNMNSSNPYDGERIAGTVGLPLPGISIRIVDPETGAPMGRGEVGMIEIAGPNVFKGYWRMPEKTASEFHDGYFISGDLGLIDQRGYVSIVGRGKDLIICGGYNVYPAEVETALDELEEVRESAVIGAPHPDMGEGVIAVVIPARPDFTDEAAISQALADRLARFKQPRRIIFVKELPKNAMGKVQKAAMREAYSDIFNT